MKKRSKVRFYVMGFLFPHFYGSLVLRPAKIPLPAPFTDLRSQLISMNCRTMSGEITKLKL